MKGEHVLAVVLAVLVLVVALQTVQLVGLKNNITGNALASTGGAGETYEQMMERMHGSSGGSAPAASSAPRQVGGC